MKQKYDISEVSDLTFLIEVLLEEFTTIMIISTPECRGALTQGFQFKFSTASSDRKILVFVKSNENM